MFRRTRTLHDRAAVGERSEIQHLPAIGARNREPDRISARGDEQRAEVTTRAVFEPHRPADGINREHARSEQ